MTLMDTPDRYGLISRMLHWAMAVLIFWQFGIVGAYGLLGQSPLLDRIAGFGPSHGVVGLLILGSLAVRVMWRRINARRRPPSPNIMARLLHGVFYALLFLIPAIALLRSFGNGRGWSHWGIQIVPATGVEVPWMVTLGNMAHGELAWILIALVGGHVVMATYHGLVRKDGLARRMV